MNRILFTSIACLVSLGLTGNAFASEAPTDNDKKNYCMSWLKKEREGTSGKVTATHEGLDKTCSCMVKHIKDMSDYDMEDAWDTCE